MACRTLEYFEAAGLPLALVSEEHGGVGMLPSDACLLMRRIAYYATPLPLAETMLAALLWSEASGDVPDGILTIATPMVDAGAARLEAASGGYCLSGRFGYVAWGDQANYVLVTARDLEGVSYLVLLPSSQLVSRRRCNVAFEPRPEMHADGMLVPASLVRRTETLSADGLLVFGALLRSQQMVGAMERSIEYALEYANDRKQFGRTLSAFQAIQHMMADAAGDYAASVAAADGAAEAWGSAAFTHSVAIAKGRVGEAAGRVAATCHQVYGAMGFTHEHPLHFSTRRLWSWRDEFGGETYWQERVGRAICAGGGNAVWDYLIETTRPQRVTELGSDD